MRRYTMAQLEAFAAIADLGSFRLAAERLGLTQPTISLRIRELETSLGCALFVRGKGGVRLSEAGQVMLQYVQRGLDVFDEMTRHLATGDPLRGVLRLGSSNTFALSCLPAVLAALEESQPGLRVALTVSNSTTLGALLGARKLDVAFLVDMPVPAHVRIEPIALSEIAWFAGAGSRIGRRTVRPGDLVAERIVTLPPPSPFHTIISDWFATTPSPLPMLSTCNDMATIVRLVRAGVAVSVLPACVVDVELEAGSIVRHRATPPLAPLTLCAAYQAAVRGRTSDVILRVARDAVARARGRLVPTRDGQPPAGRGTAL
ncbi:MAG: LysR family transcriptional regulator [Rhodoplanes sp.]|uniref:LysR family transcriptional regulator n=1 Tax=Rhodoplanes sp. TaxID=1968906 RepID=UPI0017DAD711|nr:LysR family transcriptional regulator [Rhodoplanes sp.]NVO12500.1 LysR family transcriptional regulator [Rhodoplanes sp.]